MKRYMIAVLMMVVLSGCKTTEPEGLSDEIRIEWNEYQSISR